MTQTHARLLLIGLFLFCCMHCSSVVSFTLLEKDKSEADTDIFSDEGIQCEQDGKRCVAKGNVRVTRGDAVLTCHRLTAWFAKDEENKMTLARLKAEGNVRIDSSTKSYQATAHTAEYNAQKKEVRLFGNPVIQHPELSIWGSNEILYNQDLQKADSKGFTTVVKKDNLLQADHIHVDFTQANAPDPSREEAHPVKVDVIEARGHVLIATPDELIRADQGDYAEKTQVAHMQGNVIISRCEGQLRGSAATVNLKTGQSEMTQGTPASDASDGRLQLIMMPKKRDKTK